MLGKKYFGFRGQNLNLAVAILAGLDFLLFGYDQGVMGGILSLQSFVKVFPEIDVVNITTANGYSEQKVYHTTIIQGISVASYNVGCFFGAIITIFVGDVLGRRRMIVLGLCIMVVGASLQCSAGHLGQLIAGRVITGCGNGMNTSTVPMWQSETSKSHKRGKMVMIEGAMITGGIALSYWLDFGFSFLEPSTVAWRFPIAFQLVFILLILAFVMRLPESPRWLILRGREHEALDVLSALSDLPPDDAYVRSEFAAIKETVLEMSAFGFRDLFSMGPDRCFHRVVLGFMSQCFQQITGINLITYYAASIYENYIGLSPFLSRILAALNGTEYFMASWVAVFTIEKFGRRTLMLFGAVGMSFSMVVLAVMTYLSQQNIGGSAPGVVDAVFLFVFNTFFAIGWLGMTWLYPAEIVPLRVRGPSNALSTSSNWAFNFMVVMITPVAFESIGYQTYIIFAVINAFLVPVVYVFYPETAYRSLEEMDAIFRKTRGWLGVVAAARDEPRRFGKHGEMLIEYEQTEEHRHRVAAAGGIDGGSDGKARTGSLGEGEKTGIEDGLEQTAQTVEHADRRDRSSSGDASTKSGLKEKADNKV